jgi:membrane associated rhomboid family serine protease
MIVPWQVDVPQDRWPVMNWLIILATVGVFALQVRDAVGSSEGPGPHERYQRPTEPGSRQPIVRPDAPQPPRRRVAPGITEQWMLRGWHLKGLLGHIWLHGGLLHLIGNMWFLWIFGNAVCAKVGNLAYLPLYVLLGIAAGVTHLLTGAGPVIGASGAINGIVGMYLVLFYANDITCYFIFLPFIIRQFDVSSFWMILVWLFWDIVGAFWCGGSGVAHFAHLGGFAAGFGIAVLLCWRGWITMTWYEKSLWQAWQQRRAEKAEAVAPPTNDLDPRLAPAPTPAAPAKPIPLLDLGLRTAEKPPVDPTIHVSCSCGRKIRAPRQYAGKTVLCPRCRERILIPQAGAPEARGLQKPPPAAPAKKPSGDVIRFACPCGRRISVPARYAGRSGKCPQCGERVRVPGLPHETSGESA